MTEWAQNPPFIVTESSNGTYLVTVKLRDRKQMHEAHDLIIAAFKRADDETLAANVIRAQQA